MQYHFVDISHDWIGMIHFDWLYSYYRLVLHWLQNFSRYVMDCQESCVHMEMLVYEQHITFVSYSQNNNNNITVPKTTWPLHWNNTCIMCMTQIHYVMKLKELIVWRLVSHWTQMVVSWIKVLCLFIPIIHSQPPPCSTSPNLYTFRLRPDLGNINISL